MDSHQAEYDAIIQKLIDKSVTINEIIGHLHKNRLKFSDSKNNPKHNCTFDLKDPKNDSYLFDKYVNSNFVSYFLKYLHDESNSYIMLRLQSQSNQINFSDDKSNLSGEPGKLTNKNTHNLEDSYNNSFHISPKTCGPFISPSTANGNNIIRNSPNDYSNILQNNSRNSGGGNKPKRSLPNQIHQWSTPNSVANANELKSSPTEFSNIIFNNKNKKKTLVLQPKNAWENSSTPKIVTPTYSNKLTRHKSATKNTLFDFVTSPPLIACQTSSSKQDAANDFKARFYQHQNNLNNNNNNNNQQNPNEQNTNPNNKQRNVTSQPLMATELKPAEVNASSTKQTPQALMEQPIKQLQNPPRDSPQKQNPQKQITDFKKAVLEKLSESEMNKLSVLAELYACLLLNNFILTINTELFFLFQLLTLSVIDEKPELEKKKDADKKEEYQAATIFGSMEACIYFSMLTLKHLECILKFLKSSTLLELKENIYIKSFSNLFDQDSVVMSHEINKEEIKSKQSRFIFFESKQAPFYAESNSFHDKNMSIASKNQRDAFYDIFWQWEKNHKLENWNFAECLGDKIRLLVSLKENMTHFMQFIKLFQEQLILICKDDKMLIDNKDSQLDGPEHIRSIYDPLKLKRLNARMSTPKPNYGPNPSPIFFGYQEFFKEFIDISSSPIFIQYLKDNIANEIELIHREIPDMVATDESSFNKDMVEDMLLRLRILGKFLGYLYFSPYSYAIPNHFVKNLVEIRNNSLMPLNLVYYIERAVERRHLILTIPFVVEFLSMMDEHAYLIDSIQQAISMLIIIYNSTSMHISSEEFSIDKFLLLIYIAWLLQLKKIQYSKLKINEKLLTIDMNKVGVDSFSIINPLLLDFCCPFLDELQRLMVKFTTGVRRYEQKIKDVSHLFAFELVNEYSANQSNFDSNHKFDKHQIQMQLISQFLFLHPSYKRLVEFAAETTMTNYIKYFRQNIFKRRLNEEIKLEATEQLGKEYDSIEAEVVLNSIAKRISKKFGTICVENSLEFFKEKIENVIRNSIDRNSTPLINTTNQIALYKTTQKLSQWIRTNLNEETFCAEIKLKMCKKIINNDQLLYGFLYNEKDNQDNSDVHKMMQTNYLLLFEKFNYFKVLLKELASSQQDRKSQAATEQAILKALTQIKDYLIENESNRKLLKPFDVQLCNLVWETVMFYLDSEELENNLEGSFLKRVIEGFIGIELLVNKRNEASILQRLFCPRNLYFLQSIENKEPAIEYVKLLLTTSIRNAQKTEKLEEMSILTKQPLVLSRPTPMAENQLTQFFT